MATVAAPPPLVEAEELPRRSRSQNATNAIIHMWRGEVGRLTAYRARLDTTTNWAISASGLAVTFALGRNDISHAALLFLMFLLFFFLHVEARHFRHYETSRHRAEVLEQLLLPEVTGQSLDREKEESLARSLHELPPPVSTLGSLGWRLRRNYIWIYSAVLLTWIAKLELTGRPSSGTAELLERASIGSLPGWVVLVAVLTSYAWLMALAVMARQNYPLGDEYVRRATSNVPD